MLAYINNIAKSQDYSIEFKGLNKTTYVSEGEFSDMYNICSDKYPALTPICKRLETMICEREHGATSDSITGAISKDGYIWITSGRYLVKYDSDNFFEEEWDIGLSGVKTQMVINGAYIVIWPDGIVFNTEDKSFENINKTHTESYNGGWLYARISNKNGGYCNENDLDLRDIFSEFSESDVAPLKPQNGEYWLDTSINILKQWSEQQQMWVDTTQGYVFLYKIIGEEYAGYSDDSQANLYMLHQGDSVTFEYVTFSNNRVPSCTIDNLIVEKTIDVFTTYDNNNVRCVGVVMKGETNNQLSKVVATRLYISYIKRKVPEMDFITEMGNRIWGCSSANHEIYACMQGRPTSWYKYEGIADDSYAATIGTDGDFTGIASDSNAVYFFKENCLHYVTGTKPANFTIYQIKLPGIEKGSHNSIRLLNGYFYYKSARGIMCFNGSTASDISEKLQISGYGNYRNAIAGIYRDKYYVVMECDSGGKELYVLDTAKAMWYREEHNDCVQFIENRDDLYLIADNGQRVKRINSIDDNKSGQSWYMVTGDIDGNTNHKKYISKVMLRLQLDKFSKFRVDIMYDNDDVWHKVWEIRGARDKQSFTAPIISKRCDHFKIKFSGEGNFILYSLSKVVEVGSL